jgi:trans-aconitate 2-methyltransferase
VGVWDPTQYDRFRDERRQPFYDLMGMVEPRDYALLLCRLGYRRHLVRLQVYVHELGSVDDVVEWVKGTLLTAYERRLPAELYARYLERYRARLRERTGDPRPYLYTYDRILMWAAEPGVAARAAQPILSE